jgi:hypothetical protein
MMTTVQVWLGGEGPNDLGDSDQPAHCRQQPGALEALLRREVPGGWSVLGATRWSRLRKYVAGGAIGKEGRHGPRDARHVKDLLLQAREKGADVLAFLRDIDDHEDRAAIIKQSLAQSEQETPPGPSWSLASPGRRWRLGCWRSRGARGLMRCRRRGSQSSCGRAGSS